MIAAVLDFARRARDELAILPGLVLEVGAFDVNGTIREVFEASSVSYLGVDLVPGPGVDLVVPRHGLLDVLGSRLGAFDTVLCCECLEHDPKPWITVYQMRALLKSGGYLLVTTPTFGFPLHRYPIDCYRFGEDAYREFIFEGMELLRLEEVHAAAGHPVICGLGRKP